MSALFAVVVVDGKVETLETSARMAENDDGQSLTLDKRQASHPHKARTATSDIGQEAAKVRRRM